MADAIFYIYLQSYPIIFTGIYGFTPGEQGLTFLPIGVGALISACFYLTWDWYLTRAQRADKPWARKEEMVRLPLACIAGPFFVISSFWLGWTAREDIHWMGALLLRGSTGLDQANTYSAHMRWRSLWHGLPLPLHGPAKLPR